MRKNLILSALLIVTMSFTALSASRMDAERFVEAPYKCDIKKEKRTFKKRFRDIRTAGRFAIYKIELINQDTVDHIVDYSCFCLVDGSGSEYDVHPYATIVKQTELEDVSLLKGVDVSGFNNQYVKSKFAVSGWLIFEVYGVDEYHMKFRGYLK